MVDKLKVSNKEEFEGNSIHNNKQGLQHRIAFKLFFEGNSMLKSLFVIVIYINSVNPQ
jgi:hypothetical protein